jgi:hypothetical protein
VKAAGIKINTDHLPLRVSFGHFDELAIVESGVLERLDGVLINDMVDFLWLRSTVEQGES